MPADWSRVEVEATAPRRAPSINYLEREARNRSLGAADEEFVINFERARLLHAGRENLAAKRLSTRPKSEAMATASTFFREEPGRERLIEVKTTKYGRETPFFVSRNELVVSEARANLYHLYRLFEFCDAPWIFTLNGALSATCRLDPHTWQVSYDAQPGGRADVPPAALRLRSAIVAAARRSTYTLGVSNSPLGAT